MLSNYTVDLVKAKHLYTEYIYFSEGNFFENACPNSLEWFHKPYWPIKTQ